MRISIVNRTCERKHWYRWKKTVTSSWDGETERRKWKRPGDVEQLNYTFCHRCVHLLACRERNKYFMSETPILHCLVIFTYVWLPATWLITIPRRRLSFLSFSYFIQTRFSSRLDHENSARLRRVAFPRIPSHSLAFRRVTNQHKYLTKRRRYWLTTMNHWHLLSNTKILLVSRIPSSYFVFFFFILQFFIFSIPIIFSSSSLSRCLQKFKLIELNFTCTWKKEEKWGRGARNLLRLKSEISFRMQDGRKMRHNRVKWTCNDLITWWRGWRGVKHPGAATTRGRALNGT